MLEEQLDLFTATTAAIDATTTSHMPSSRPYQLAARKAVAEVFTRSRGALVVLPTGTGKSHVCATICLDQRDAGRKVLVLCPTIVLCHQMYDGLRKAGLRVGLEQADNRTSRPFPDVVVASVQTMTGQRLRSFPRDAFGLVVADECHRSPSAGPMAIFNHFIGANRLGLTATPIRMDGVSLSNVFDEVAIQLSMIDAIKDGWLVPIKLRTAVTDFDARALRTIAGEINASSVEAEIVRSGLLHEAAAALAELSSGERTIAFLPTVASSKALVAELAARGVNAAHVDGTTTQEIRERYFDQLKSGDIKVISNVAIMTEGVDLPAVSVIALLSPTKSWARLTQMIGRATRLAPGKDSALVLDFCPGRMKKGRLASPADALAGRMLPDNVYDCMAKEGDLADVIAKAEKKAEEIEEKKRRAKERAEKKAGSEKKLSVLAVKKDFSYYVQDHDSESVLGGNGGDDSDGRLEQRRVRLSENEKRKAAGMCTEKQGKFLDKYGLDPQMNRKLAGYVIGRIVSNKFRLPSDIASNQDYRKKR